MVAILFDHDNVALHSHDGVTELQHIRESARTAMVIQIWIEQALSRPAQAPGPRFDRGDLFGDGDRNEYSLSSVFIACAAGSRRALGRLAK